MQDQNIACWFKEQRFLVPTSYQVLQLPNSAIFYCSYFNLKITVDMRRCPPTARKRELVIKARITLPLSVGRVRGRAHGALAHMANWVHMVRPSCKWHTCVL